MNTQLLERKVDFIPLNKKVLAEYVFVFKVNDAYTITDLNQVHAKHQLLIQRLDNKNQQLNLMFVDSVFFNILSDVVLEVLLNKAQSFNQYMALNTKCISFSGNDESKYLEYKFMDFIHFMLYSNIASTTPFKGETDLNRVYCLKNINEELEYFSVYEQYNLKKKLLNDLMLSIDYTKSTVIGNELRLCLKIHTKLQTSDSSNSSAAYTPWSPEQDAKLRDLHSAKITVLEIAKQFERTPGAIRSRLKKLNLI